MASRTKLFSIPSSWFETLAYLYYFLIPNGCYLVLCVCYVVILYTPAHIASDIAICLISFNKKISSHGQEDFYILTTANSEGRTHSLQGPHGSFASVSEMVLFSQTCSFIRLCPLIRKCSFILGSWQGAFHLTKLSLMPALYKWFCK